MSDDGDGLVESGSTEDGPEGWTLHRVTLTWRVRPHGEKTVSIALPDQHAARAAAYRLYESARE